MYRDMTFEKIMEQLLARVPDSIDKREGAVIYLALAPSAAELAEMYIELSTLIDRAFPDTAEGRDLTLKASERSLMRQPATFSKRKGIFTDTAGTPTDVPLGIRFSGGDVNYTVSSKIAPGEFTLTAETAGTVGNTYAGNLLPVDFIDGLGSAVISDVLIPGENEETDAELRARYYESLEVQPFGGNVQDYKDKAKKIDGVGGVKVYSSWNGGGTVKLVLVNTDWGVPSSTLVDTVQAAVDPLGSQGQGLGTAPIGHVVTVEGVTSAVVNVSSNITLQSGFTWEAVKPGVVQAINAYFVDLIKSWENTKTISADNGLVVRISQIETRALDIAGVLDISGTKINGAAANLALDPKQIPNLGDVTNEASA